MSRKARLVVGISGASGTIYAERLFFHLRNWSGELIVTASRTGREIIMEERGLNLPQGEADLGGLLEQWLKLEPGSYLPRVSFYPHGNLAAPIASGSFRTMGMIIIPSSMAKVAALAVGQSRDLMERAADVTLKEGRPLVIVPRETPLSAIHLENLLKLARLGVRVVPAMPGFYHHPQTLEEIADFIAVRALQAMGFDLPLAKEWQGSSTIIGEP